MDKIGRTHQNNCALYTEQILLSFFLLLFLYISQLSFHVYSYMLNTQSTAAQSIHLPHIQVAHRGREGPRGRTCTGDEVRQYTTAGAEKCLVAAIFRVS
jgi:hypothetical protein